MRERDLRSKAAQRRKQVRGFKEDDVDKKYWQWLEEMGFVGDALEQPHEEEAVDFLLSKIDAMLDALPERAKQGRFHPTGRNWDKVFAPQLGPRELERSELFEDYLAALAANDFDVQAFRERVLGNKKLSEEEAYSFLDSPARQFFGRGFFEAHCVPLLEHTATVQECKLELKHGVRALGFSIRVEPGDIIKTAYLKRDAKGHLPKLTFPGRADAGEVRRTEGLSVNRGSVLDALRKLSEKLAKRYSWQTADATWFVLTHKGPAVPPAKGQYRVKGGGRYAYGEITLTAMPWVSAETVSDLYRRIQQQALGGDKQPIKEKALKLMRFVMESVRQEGLSPADLSSEERSIRGSQLVDKWNQLEWVREQPQDSKRDRAYRGDQKTRWVWRDFSNALSAVAYQPLSGKAGKRRRRGSSGGSNRDGKQR